MTDFSSSQRLESMSKSLFEAKRSLSSRPFPGKVFYVEVFYWHIFRLTAKLHHGDCVYMCVCVLCRDVNTAIMELLVMAYALKTSCAKNIIGVIPYFPYSKQCKMRKRGSIVCKLLASMLAKAGIK